MSHSYYMLGVCTALDVNTVALADGAVVLVWARLLGAGLARGGEDCAELLGDLLVAIRWRRRSSRVVDWVDFRSAACSGVVSHQEASATDFTLFGIL